MCRKIRFKNSCTSKVVKCAAGFREFLLSLFHGIKFRVVFTSAEWFGTEFQELAYIFVKQIGIPSIFLFRGMVRNGIPRVCLYFCSTVHNSEHFPLPRNGSEWNSESFLFCGTAGIPQEQTNSFVYPIRFFLSKMANPAVAVDHN
jgi:hypothetical protein